MTIYVIFLDKYRLILHWKVETHKVKIQDLCLKTLQFGTAYLFLDWATDSHGAPVISPWTRVSFRNFLTIFPPLTSICDLINNKNPLLNEPSNK
ncbi:hypothetical protein HanIR_Chr12g0589171 [Helianthus annuus]|nr:hypothetical protein HanIR_Chr12g0589171 [Helianthus annuus]